MKKLLLPCLPFVAALTGCDYSCFTDFVVINQTASIIEVNGEYGQIKIYPNEEGLVYMESDLCGDRSTLSDRYAEYPDWKIVNGFNMTINGENVSEEIWTRKYWEFSSIIVRKAKYTLTFTEELLETLSFENNPNS